VTRYNNGLPDTAIALKRAFAGASHVLFVIFACHRVRSDLPRL